MPRDAGDYLPSWETGTDMGAEAGLSGMATEEQVRQWLQANGFDDPEIDRIMTNANTQHKGGKAMEPGTPINEPGANAQGIEREDWDNPMQQEETKSPKPMFPGDRMGR